ncbi:WD40 repeat domain-containing protein [Ktedonobacter sp. SOSP1-85]|uniref:WD40 repeat domain-containing protein n=1 Tax=Ktedonobacter sp. SOSP1-85 TaxID=2778367 RepID=UPI001915BF99|nr:WD40 repeat domain-containing protein [Ktedonobacter sp. SOSP1-85]
MKQDGFLHMHSRRAKPFFLPIYSRRHFCSLATMSVLVAACQSPAPVQIPATPTPRSTLKPIIASNAHNLAQIGVLENMQDKVRGLCWSPDGSFLAVAPGEHIQIWQSASLKQVATLQGKTGSINGMAWSSDGTSLATAGDKGIVQIWQTTNWQTQRLLNWQTTSTHPRPELLSVAWSPTSKRLVAGNADGALLLWDTTNGKNLGLWEGPGQYVSSGGRYPYAVWGVAWSPDGLHIVSNRYDKYTFMWDTRSSKITHQLPPQDQPNGVAYSPNGQFVATSNDAGTVQIWDAQGKRVRVLTGHTDAGWAYPVMWSPDNSLLATARAYGLVQLWEVQSGQELVAIQGHNAGVFTGSWSPSGTIIATGSDDATVRLWGVTR